MANNVILLENLDADAVTDDTKEKIRFESILGGEGDPVAPPPVPEKFWFYLDLSTEPYPIWAWVVDDEAWAQAGAAVEGGGSGVTSVDGDPGPDVVLTDNYQPLDPDLTAIAALTTTPFGRGLLTQADVAAGRLALGLGTAATQSSGSFDPSGAAAAAEAASQPLDGDLTAIAALSTTSYGRAFLALANHAALVTYIDLVAADIPALPASKITSGQLDVARVASGTATDGYALRVASGALTLVPAAREIFLTADVSYTSNDVLANTALALSVEAHRDYAIEVVLFYGGPSAANLKVNFTIPSGASGRVGLTDQAQLANSTTIGTDITLTGPTSTNIRIAVFKLYLGVGANAGSITVQASQGTSNATPSIIKAGSSMRLMGGGVANP